jgi:peroxiredoxin Q/BCP
MKQIKVGDPIPSFTAMDHEGFELSHEDLIGSPFVLYFYPKDDTPGCTKEACSFRDNMDRLDELDAVVIGVSPDSSESHNKFIDKHQLNFTLLCDETLELAHLFGAIKEKEVSGKKSVGILRSTFVVDSNGIVRWIEQPVNVEGHADRVIEAVRALSVQIK